VYSSTPVSQPSPGRKILVVDDDPAIRDALADALRDSGYEVLLAEDGWEGIARLRAAPLPDAILLDLFMPRMSGWDFVRELRRSAAAVVPVIVVTAVEPHFGYPVPRTQVLRKPVDMDALLALLERACTDGFPTPSE
jgi:two-component system, chemotaxis family, chemotaxis protein CheY